MLRCSTTWLHPTLKTVERNKRSSLFTFQRSMTKNVAHKSRQFSQQTKKKFYNFSESEAAQPVNPNCSGWSISWSAKMSILTKWIWCRCYKNFLLILSQNCYVNYELELNYCCRKFYNIDTCDRCYKTFYGCKLRLFIIS